MCFLLWEVLQVLSKIEGQEIHPVSGFEQFGTVSKEGTKDQMQPNKICEVNQKTMMFLWKFRAFQVFPVDSGWPLCRTVEKLALVVDRFIELRIWKPVRPRKISVQIVC